MDRNTLSYFTEILSQDAGSLTSAVISGDGIADEELKRVVNTKLETLKADIANVQHFIEEA